MLRYILAGICVLALAAPAYGYEVIWDGDPDGNIDINLQIDCYIQIIWQDTDINFTDQPPYDWWSTTLVPVGNQRCPDDGNQHPMYPWAGDAYYAASGRYYESDDGATIYIHSNNDLTMRVHTNGDLTGTNLPIPTPPNTIPTWFTLALCPFQINSVWIAGHNIPFCGNPGCYASDTDTDGNMEVCTCPDHPNQFVFPCAPASQDFFLDLDAETQGTMKFLARIHRNGMADPGDLYYTFLDVHFTTP
jgi:hypothetical protein